MKTQKTSYPQDTKRAFMPNAAIGFLLFINCFIGAYNYSTDNNSIDFFTWWSVPHGISRQYIEMPYSEESEKKLAAKIAEEIDSQNTPNVEKKTIQDIFVLYEDRIITTASPFFYSFIKGFVSANYQLDKRKFILLSLVLFTVAFFLLGRMLNFSFLTLFILYALITICFSAYLLELKVSNINQLQFFLVTLFILLSVGAKGFYSHVWAGFFIGLSILLKLNAGFILFFAMLAAIFYKDIKKAFAYILGFLLSCVLAFLMTASYFKSLHMEAWKSWINTLPTTIAGNFSMISGNYSLSRLIDTNGGPNIAGVLYIAVLCLFLWTLYSSNKYFDSIKTSSAVKKEKELRNIFLVVGFGVLAMLLCGNLVWTHYYVATIPIFLFLLRPQPEKNMLTKALTYTALFLSTQFLTRQLPFQEAYVIKLNVSIAILMFLLVREMTQPVQEK